MGATTLGVDRQWFAALARGRLVVSMTLLDLHVLYLFELFFGALHLILHRSFLATLLFNGIR